MHMKPVEELTCSFKNTESVIKINDAAIYTAIIATTASRKSQRSKLIIGVGLLCLTWYDEADTSEV